MKTNELKIGNWVKGNAPFRIEYDDFRLSMMWEKTKGVSRFEPIPLTEEWLVKFGFDTNTGGYWQIGFDKCERLGFQMGGRIETGIHLIDEIDSEIGTPCKHVHQLQNLYFALTGEELTTKNK
tara:strand:- start:407 stop:775 length:369 start_codon:yes stop_codon:yes gene_type:complete